MNKIRTLKHGPQVLKIGAAAAILCLLSAGVFSAPPEPSPVIARDRRKDVEAVTERFRRRIPVLMRQGKIPGLAVALVDRAGAPYKMHPRDQNRGN